MRYRLLSLVLVILLSHPAVAQTPFYLRDGDVVVFYGDSITEQRLYSGYVEEFVTGRYPDLKVTFVHSGVGGDRVTGGSAGPIDVRLDRDVIRYRPTVVTIMLGMNDGRYQFFSRSTYHAYTRGLEHIVDRLRAALPHARLSLIQPSPYDEMTRPVTINGGYNTTLERFGAFADSLADADGHLGVDFHHALADAAMRAYSASPDLSRMLLPDRIHPGEAGHMVMAAALLEAWGASPLVTAVEIDGLALTVRRQENTLVSNLVRSDSGLTWQQADRVIPFWIDTTDPTIELVARTEGLIRRLNHQPLRVTGLNPGRYRLLIDGMPVATLLAAQLEESVDLGYFVTSMTGQARSLHFATRDHNELHRTQFRVLERGGGTPEAEATTAFLERLEAASVQAQRSVARAKTHQYRIERLP